MRLSVVFELLLIFLIIAFAAYGRVVPENKDVWNVGLNNVKEHLKVMGRARQAAPQAAPPNRYCACSNLMCNCCRDFSLPVVPIKGPGCASLKYLKGDQMAVTMSFGDRVLRNTTISGKKPKPVCMALPGGISKFCGRVYGISRDGDQFKACLGLELRALDDVEAALRVSCFRFGPQGMKVEPAQPLPASETLQGEDEDDEDDEDDDDDDDDYGLGGGSDDDDAEDDDDDAADEDAENDVESTGDADYTGLSALSTDFLDSLFGGGGGGGEDDEVETTAKPTAKPSAVAATTATKSKVTAAPQQVTEKHGGSAESVTSTSYTVSVVQDASSSSETSAEARPTAAAPLDDSPTDRVETVPTPAADKRKDYEDDEDDDDDDDEDDDIVSDIIETAASAAASAASAVGMADATADQNSTVATATTKAAAQVTTEAATTAATGSNGFGPAGKDYDDDDEDDDDGFRSLKRMPAAIVPNDRRGRTHRRMRLSSSDDESTIHFMRKV